jgi:glycosyltransferase involved in cell wall biosynthesis
VLPFANQRAPRTEAVTDADRAAARERLGFAPDLVHLGTFGYVDLRTKLTDVVVEAAAWLTQWGHRVALHVVGAAAPTQEQSLRARAADAGIERLDITGFASDEVFRDHLLAVDLGVQLRISPMLGVSGPLSDLAAFGTPSVASRGLAIDVDTPDYVERLPDDVSPVLVAEAIERLLARRLSAAEIEPMRREYLAGKSPRRYAEQFLAVVSRYAGGGA